MIDGASIAAWTPTILRWLKGGFGIFRVLRGTPTYPNVSIVPHRHLCQETTEPDGKVITHIHLTVALSNMRDVGLVIVKAECHVHWHGRVQTPFFQGETMPPRSHMDETFRFIFARGLGKPRWCKLILYDQFDKQHAKWVRLRYGSPHDPY